jgi:glycosyltransferase involved in cell wall biosynthesis
MTDVSLMMVTYNRLNLTKPTIESIYKNTDLPFNLIIVDNASTDGTIEYLNELKNNNDNIHLHFNNENRGIARGRNRALKMAEDLNTKWFATLDNDVLLPNKWISQCIDIIKANPSYCIGVSFEQMIYPKVNRNGYEFEEKPKGNLGTACSVFGGQLVKMIGYFISEYERYGEDDANLFARARFAGFKLGYLLEHGTHLGEGENDTGPYREFKDECRKKNLAKFQEDCRLYAAGKKNIRLPYDP